MRCLMQPIAAQVISKQVSTSHPPYIPYFIKEKEWNKTRPIWTRNADDVSTMSTLGKSQGEMGLQLIVFKDWLDQCRLGQGQGALELGATQLQEKSMRIKGLECLAAILKME